MIELRKIKSLEDFEEKYYKLNNNKLPTETIIRLYEVEDKFLEDIKTMVEEQLSYVSFLLGEESSDIDLNTVKFRDVYLPKYGNIQIR